MSTVKIFEYLEPLDAFTVTETYRRLAEKLGLTEWSPVVWIGRLFLMDNDFGEHWFDNWDLREEKTVEAERLGFDASELFIIAPSRFSNGKDGPCHTGTVRKLFWTDVLKSLELSYGLLFEEARQQNKALKAICPKDAINDLEQRITEIASENQW